MSTWAIFCKYGVDVRSLKLSKEQLKQILDGDTSILIENGLTPKKTKEDRTVEYENLYKTAHEAGCNAVKECNVVPMVVSSLANPLDNSSIEKSWYVADGVCGFAWVNIRPGNCGFANYMKKHHGARKSYYGGVDYWIHEYGQSMQKKEAYARAFAEVVRSAGISCYSHSRMD